MSLLGRIKVKLFQVQAIGNVCDLDRGCAVVLDEFRAGKLGRITLELPAQETRRRIALPGAAPREEENHGEN